MNPLTRRFRHMPALAVVVALLSPQPGAAQITPAAGHTPPDDTPSVKVGGTIFTDYTYVGAPKSKDADMNSIHTNQFNVARAYLNITGNISHLLSFRITPDVTRESGTGSSLAGSLTFRLKYAYGQLNLDKVAKGSWLRLGMQQTPWVDFVDSAYRYRFQGTTLEDREGVLSSSDLGVSARYNLPGNYGDVHAGIYNGEGYNRSETNDRKAFQIRASIRPAPMAETLRGLRLTAFYDADEYLQSGAKQRFVGAATFEHKYLHAGANLLRTKDRTSAAKDEVEGEGFSVWATPRSKMGLEGLLRFDRLKPNKDIDASKHRAIVGLAYWFPVQKGVTAALLADFEKVDYDSPLGKPDEKRYALHALFNF